VPVVSVRVLQPGRWWCADRRVVALRRFYAVLCGPL